MVLVVLTAWCHVTRAQQPFGGCWHPDYIITWTPEQDPDAKFNRSTVPLQPRFVDNMVKANANQHPEGKVAACLTMNPSCSQTPSQGANNFIGYNPTYWQYMDLLIWWGGSAGEGIIIPPSAPVTDIAHLNGVKVLGQLFFPPSAFGGQTKWVKQMLTKTGDTYPYAKKMYEIAAYYGFDGWFINEETGGGTAAEWTEWVAYFNKCAEEGGHPEMEIQWYDCGTTIGQYGDMMKLHNTSYFLNYGSPSAGNIDSQMSAIQGMGFSKEEAFSKLYFGIEVAQGGLDGNASYFKNLFPADGHKGSIDLFNPEEHAWKKVVENLLNTDDACGSKAYAAMNTVFSKEARYWTNSENDPSNVSGRDGSYFPGLANAILERSTIQSLPFVTSFSAGLGKHRFVNGEKRGTQDWYHRGMQDILPTWRWWVDVESAHKSDLTFAYSWDDAYNMGTSVRVSGNLTAGVDYLTHLFKTRLALSAGDKFQLVYKGTAPTIELMVGVSENDNEFTKFTLDNTSTSNGWTVATVDLSSLAGKTASVLSLNFKGSGNCDFLLGQLAVLPANYAPASLKVSNLAVQNELTQEGGDLRVIWDAPESDDVHHYNIYLIRSTGTRTLVGQTRNEGFYIPKFERVSPDEKSVDVEVAVVTKDLKEGTQEKLTVMYPEVQKPNVSIKASKTLVEPGTSVVFTASADNYPESYKWTVPEGAVKESEEGNQITMNFPNEGVYNITVAVTNQVGETVETVEGLVEVSASKAGELTNVAAHKVIHSCSGSLPPEDPDNLIDGVQVPGSVRDKWCIGGSKQHWVVIDLKQAYQIYRFQFFDCGNKENYSDNVKNYKIWVSDDAENWGEPVVDETGRPENTKDDYVKPVVGRYVKFMPYDNDMPITIRIWEFEVYGLEGGPIFEAPANESLSFEEVKNVKFTYDLNGETAGSDFEVKVTSENEEVVKVSDLNIDQEKQEVSFNLNAQQTPGFADVTIEFINNGWKKSDKFNVEVIDDSYVNVLFGKDAVIGALYFEEWSEETVKTVTDADVETVYETSGDGGECIRLTVDCGALYEFAKATLKSQSPADGIRFEISQTGEEGSFVEAGTVGAGEGSFNIPLDTETAIGRYVRFWVSVEAYSDFVISEIEAYGKKYVAPVYTPIEIVSGFNADVIAEATPSKEHTNVVLDDQGWVLYGPDVQAEGAMPADGMITSASGALYKVADYAGNNAATLKQAYTTATLEFAEPTQAKQINLLSISANGTSSVEVTINYEDMSSITKTFSISDWWGSAAGDGEAVYGLGRIITDAVDIYDADEIDHRMEFRLFEQTIETDPTKNIVSVKVGSYRSGSYPTILAVSKLSDPEEVAPVLTLPESVQNGSLKVTYEGETEELANGAELENGRNIVIEAVPDQGYEVERLIVNGAEQKLTDNRCVVTVETDIVIGVSFTLADGIAENEMSAAVYPTLFDNQLVVCAAAGESVVVTNVAGVQVYSATQAGEKMVIATSNWEAGIYFVKVAGKTVKVIRR